MSRLWPHPAYAEDQPYAHSILTTHVLTRGVQTGSLVGAGVGSSLYLLRHYRFLAPRIPPSTFTNTLLRSTGVAAVVGFGILAVGLPMRMRGKEKIEWQDRSWRLLENKGQLECDDWTYPAMVVGLATAATRGRTLGWRGMAAGAGLGGLVGMMGYMGWRYSVRGGKFDEKP
jgi:hypothetical protein